MKRKILYFLFPFLLAGYTQAQIVINEASNRNYTLIYDESGDNDDWIELYNAGNTSVNLAGWSLSDNILLPEKWKFPGGSLNAGAFSLIYASGKDVKTDVNHWETAVLSTDIFDYIIPATKIPSDWNTPGYSVSGWGKGKAGFGYGDNDDSTKVKDSTLVIYIRRNFNIPDTSAIAEAIVNIDYDDGFVAYLNGTEICRSNINGTPTWNSLSSQGREALMYSGGNPERYLLDIKLVRSVWDQGENVLAFEVHNSSNVSSDLSLIPFLSFGIKTSEVFFKSPPAWFSETFATNLHTNFKISSKGETIYLTNPQKVLVDSMKVADLQLNYSIGRVKDGAVEKGIFTTPTPGTSNNSSVANTKGYEPVPNFNQPSGFYASTIHVKILCNETYGVIRYTTNGSEPTGNSPVYNGDPVVISSTKTLKARCFSTTGRLPGKVKTATYFINVKFTVPVISLSTNNENLFGSSGICDNWQYDWNKPCYVEYFDTNQYKCFEQDAGIQIDGGAGGSRSQPQHSFRIEPGNSALGDGDLNFKLFPDRPDRSTYASFYLRNGSNQYLILPYKDALEVKAMGKNDYNYYSAYRPVVVYINGGYWGLYELREKINDDYFASNYKANIDSLDLLGVSYWYGSTLRAINGSTEPFIADYNHFLTLNPQAADYLSEVDKFLDLNNYTDYIIGQDWICDSDWPWNNIKIFRCNISNYRWRFVLLDLEWSLNPNGWTDYTTDHIAYMYSQDSNIPYLRFWLNLMQNNDYKNFFINRFADLMNTNFLYSRIEPMEQQLYSEAFPEMRGEFTKWGSPSGTVDQSLATYTNNHIIFENNLKLRSGQVRQHIQNHFNISRQITVTLNALPEGAGKIKISTIIPDSLPWKGTYFSDIPITIEAIPNAGFVFSNWEKNSLISNINNKLFSCTFSTTPVQFTANFKPGTSSFSGFTISEIFYNDESSFDYTDWIELYNAGSLPVNLGGWRISDDNPEHVFVFPEGTVIPANNRLVIVKDNIKFGKTYPDVKNYITGISFGLGTPSDIINLYNNHNQLVKSVQYCDYFPWPAGASEERKSLELNDPLRNLNDPFNWFAGCTGGSPGSSYIPCNLLPVNELSKDYQFNLKTYPNPAKDYIEIELTFPEPVSFCNIKIYDLLGNEIKSLNPGRFDEGVHTERINLGNLPSGILILSFHTEKYEKRVKFIHTR